MSVANSYRQMVIERRRDYSNFIAFPDKVIIDFAKRAKKAGLDFEQYKKYVKGTFKDGADEGRAIIHGRDVFKEEVQIEGEELNEASTMVTKQWQMFSKDIIKLVKFISSPDGMELDDKNMKAFLNDMEKTLNKHLMKNDIKM